MTDKNHTPAKPSGTTDDTTSSDEEPVQDLTDEPSVPDTEPAPTESDAESGSVTASPRRLRATPRQLVFGAGIAALCVAVAGAFYAGRLTSAPSHTNPAPILDAATAYASMVANYDADHVDKYLTDMQDAATGSAAQQIRCSTQTMRQAITTLELSSRGSVVSTGLVKADGDNADVVVVIEQTSRWKDDAATTPDAAENEAANVLTLTLLKVDDTWKVSEIRSPLSPGVGTDVPGGQHEECTSQAPQPSAIQPPASTPR